LILVIGFGVPMLYSRLGARSLAGDEAIYGVVVREALAGAWQPLRYGGEIFAYPPLKLWINAWVASAWELGELALRAVDASFGLASLILVFAVTTSFFGNLVGGATVLLLLAAHNLLFVHGLRSCGLDAAPLFLMSAELLVYSAGRLRSAAVPRGGGWFDRRERRTVVGAGLLLGAACWTKFPVPGLGVVALTAWEILVAPRGARMRGLALAGMTGGIALAVYAPSPILLLTTQGQEYFEFLE